MQLFANPTRDDYHQQQTNNQGFRELMHRFPQLEFYKPSPKKSPWHVQTIVGDELEGTDIIVNFWPHTGKAQREYCKAVVGWNNAEALLKECLAEVGFDSNADEIDLVDTYDTFAAE